MKQIRLLLGLSQFQFAVLVGVNPATISRWENGVGSPSFTPGGFKRLLDALAQHGITLKDLPDDLGLAGQS